MLYFMWLFQLLQWTDLVHQKKLTISFVSISENWRQNQNGIERRRNPERWLRTSPRAAATSGESSALLFPFNFYFWPQFCLPGHFSRNVVKPQTDSSFFPSSDTTTDLRQSNLINFETFFFSSNSTVKINSMPFPVARVIKQIYKFVATTKYIKLW